MEYDFNNEIWADIKGYEGHYQVSSFGRIKSFCGKKEHILTQHDHKTGYLYVTLSKKGQAKQYRINRLVADAFLDNKDNLPIVNHKNEIKTDNNVLNLEWCTYKYNNNYGTKLEKVSKKVGQYKKDGTLVKIWQSLSDAKRAGYNGGNISSCCNGLRKTHGGYKWSFIQ